MAQKTLVGDKLTSRPGVYSLTKSGITNNSPNLEFGHVCIIDDGIGANYGGGVGQVQYDFTKIEDFQSFVKGGVLWDLAVPLFKPFDTANGVSKLSLIHARETIPAAINFALSRGTLTFTTKDQGLNANGVLSSGYLAAGYAAKLVTVSNPNALTSTFITSTLHTAVAAVAATKSTSTLTITGLGGYYLGVTVPGSSEIFIAYYNYSAADDTPTKIATSIAAQINANNYGYGYTATSNAAVVTISAPLRGVDGTYINGISLNVRAYGSSAAYTQTAFANGTTGTAARDQYNLAVAADIKVGNEYTLTFPSSINIVAVATSTSAYDLYNDFINQILNNNTLNSTYTVGIVPYNQALALAIIKPTAFTQTSSVLVSGAKFKVRIYHSTFKGIDSLNNVPYDNVILAKSKPTLIAESPEVSTIQQVVDWASSDSRVTQGFIVSSTITTTGGALLLADASNNYILAAGGGEEYSDAAFTTAINQAKQLGCNFFLSTQSGANAIGDHNDQLKELVRTGKYERFLYIAGGSTRVEYSSISQPTAEHFDAEEVVLVHGDGLQLVGLNKFKRRSVLYKTANIVGRLCGLETYTPVTFKRLSLDAEYDPLTDDEIEVANDYGVLTCYKDDELGYLVVQLGINTLQINSDFVNPDGTTYSIQLSRIKAELNKQLSIYLKKKFFSSQTSGPNRHTISTEELISATDSFLKSKHAIPGQQDNMLLSHQNITATITNNVNRVDYEATPNFEVDIILATGTIIDNQ